MLVYRPSLCFSRPLPWLWARSQCYWGSSQRTVSRRYSLPLVGRFPVPFRPKDPRTARTETECSIQIGRNLQNVRVRSSGVREMGCLLGLSHSRRRERSSKNLKSTILPPDIDRPVTPVDTGLLIPLMISSSVRNILTVKHISKPAGSTSRGGLPSL